MSKVCILFYSAYYKSLRKKKEDSYCNSIPKVPLHLYLKNAVKFISLLLSNLDSEVQKAKS